MELLPGLMILKQALYYNNTLIISDIHIGYEEMLNRKGFMIPRLQFSDMLERVEGIFDTFDGKRVERIIVNGDLKHHFGTISEQEWRNVLKFLDLLAKHCNEVILIKGNHDMILGPIARKRNVSVVDYYLIDFNTNKFINGRSLTKKTSKNKSDKIQN